ncbi:hypothetical protein COY95_00025, partial [Candidatus Woesearchaeota archaeon CG_4_10_14_0_8_um_filter_47_5]
ARESVNQVQATLARIKPDIIAVELDRKRMYALLSGKQEQPGISLIRHIGVKGFLFALLAYWAQKKLGDAVGMRPGAEMKEAILYTRANNTSLALIDQDITLTLNRISRTLTWKEKFNFLADIINSLLGRETPITFDLATVPSDDLIRHLISRVETRYPSLYKTLIAERNSFMAKKLFTLMQNQPDKKIVAVVGAGHEQGIMELLREWSAGHVDASFGYEIRL